MVKRGECTRFAFISRHCEAESSEGIDRVKLGQRTQCEQHNDIARLVYTCMKITVR